MTPAQRGEVLAARSVVVSEDARFDRSVRNFNPRDIQN
jgi:hypothetical protein